MKVSLRLCVVVADGISFEIKGLDALQAKLQAVSFDMQKKGGRFALRKAAQVIRDKAISNAASIDDPESRESISKNITERWNGRLNKKSGGNDMGFRIGVLGGAKDTGKEDSKNPGGTTFHWRFIEFGTAKMAAKPFMRPALEQSQAQVVDTFVNEYSKALDRALRKAQKVR